MRTIAESNLLLRLPCELPKGLKILTQEFHEGWGLAQSVDTRRLEGKIQARGWNFIKISAGSLKSAVGDTSQEAIAAAVRQSLRSISEHSNVVELKHLEMTQYRWFFLARVQVVPFRIQQDAAVPAIESVGGPPVAASRERLLSHSSANYLHSVGAMPMLKELLVVPSGIDGRAL